MPSSPECCPITASVGVLLETAVNTAEGVYTRGDSDILVIVTHSLGFLFVLGEVKQMNSGKNWSFIVGAIPSPAILDLCAALQEAWAPQVTGVG